MNGLYVFIFLRPVPDQLMNRTWGGVPGCQLPIRGHHALKEGRALKIFFWLMPPGVWDLSSPEIKSTPPAMEVWNLIPWITREARKRGGFGERCFN